MASVFDRKPQVFLRYASLAYDACIRARCNELHLRLSLSACFVLAKGNIRLPATRVLWSSIVVILLIVFIVIWVATQWTAWRLGFQPQLGTPWFELAGLPIYPPPAFFWWWYFYDAYAPHVFLEGGAIAASGGLLAIAAAIVMSIWRAREAKDVHTYGSARWAERGHDRDQRAEHRGAAG